MLNLTASQQAIVDSPLKTVSWLFNVTDKNLNTYYWSTKYVSPLGLGVIWASGINWDTGIDWTDGGDGSGYDFKITNFQGVRISRPKTETGIMPPSELTFSVPNKDSVLNPDDFEGGYVKLILMVGDTIAEDSQIGIWKFLIKKVTVAYQLLDFTCEDFFQQYLQGDYPRSQYKISGDAVAWASGVGWASGIVWTDGTSYSGETYGVKVHDIFPNTSGVGNLSDFVCLPLPFGTCYVPIRPAYIDTDWFYVLGPTTANGVAITYSIAKVRSPRDYSAKAEYASTFTQSTKVNADGYLFRVFQAALSSAPTDGLFSLGDHYYDLPTKFSRSDTVDITDFADAIKYVLLDIGVSPLDIDDASFATAKATFAGWGLTCNGAFWKVTTRENAITALLLQCHSTLIIGEQISLKVLDSTSQKTLTSADILKPQETGAGTFRNMRLTQILADSGNIKYSPTDDAQDVGVSNLVAAKTTKKIIDSDILNFPFVQNATIARQIARLHFQRKLLKKAEQRITTKGNCVALQPSDFITIQGDNYGGNHDIIIDSMVIKKALSIDIIGTSFTDTIENYA